MFAPGFFTGSLIKRFGALPVMGVGVALNLAASRWRCRAWTCMQFLVALFLLGVGWNFLFTGSTTLFTDGLRARGKGPGPGRAELLRLRDAGGELLRFGRAGHHAGLDAAELRLAGAGVADRRGADLAGVLAPTGYALPPKGARAGLRRLGWDFTTPAVSTDTSLFEGRSDRAGVCPRAARARSSTGATSRGGRQMIRCRRSPAPI